MADKEDEKRQFTINVGSISQLEQPVRDRVNQQINAGQGQTNKSEEKSKGSAKVKPKFKGNTTIGVAILGIVIGGILLTYLPEPAQTVMSEGAEMIQVSSANTGNSTGQMTYEELLEMRMEEILGNLDGAGNAKVMITTSGSTEKVVAEEVVQNKQGTEETTGSGTKKTSEKEDVERKVVMEKGGTPFIIKENKPQVEGVLVLAEGADDVNIKNAIIQSVSSLLDVPVHKIAVYKMVNN